MPEYAQIQTYITCSENTFPAVLQNYWTVLNKLGCTQSHIGDWLWRISWPSDKQGFVVKNDSFPSVSFTANKELFQAQLWMVMYPPEPEDTQNTWVEVGLLFEAESLRERESSRYKEATGILIWPMLRAFASIFCQSGVYFTDELQDGQAWKTLVTGEGGFWDFDLAIVPEEIFRYFQPTPKIFASASFAEGTGFALRERWMLIPWKEQELNSK